MFSLLSDGGRVLGQDTGSVLTVLTCMLWGSIVTVAAMRGPEKDGWTPADYFSLATGGWLVAVFLIIVPTFVLGVLLGIRPGLSVAAIVLAVSAGCLILVIRRRTAQSPAVDLLSLVGLAALFLLSLWIPAWHLSHELLCPCISTPPNITASFRRSCRSTGKGQPHMS